MNCNLDYNELEGDQIEEIKKLKQVFDVIK